MRLLIYIAFCVLSLSCKKKTCDSSESQKSTSVTSYGMLGWTELRLFPGTTDSLMSFDSRVYANPVGSFNNNFATINCGTLLYNGLSVPYSWTYLDIYTNIFGLPGMNSFKTNFLNANIQYTHPSLGLITLNSVAQMPYCPSPLIPDSFSLSSPFVVNLGSVYNSNRVSFEISSAFNKSTSRENISSHTKFTFMPSEIAGTVSGDSININYNLIKDTLYVIAGDNFWVSRCVTFGKKIVVVN